MSYDIYLRTKKPPCGECGRAFENSYISWIPTYNLTPIFDRALTGEELPNPDVSEAQVVLFKEKTDRPRGLRLLSGHKATRARDAAHSTRANVVANDNATDQPTKMVA